MPHVPTPSDIKTDTPSGSTALVGGPVTRWLHGMPTWSYHALFWSMVTVFLATDLITKYAVFAHFNLNPTLSGEEIQHRAGLGVPVIGEAFYFTPAKNTGAAWSILSGKLTLLTLISALVVIAVSLWQITGRLKKENVLMHLALAMILGGAFGNLYDRMMFGGVRDFLHLRRPFEYPIFNVADIWLCIGVAVYALDVFFLSKPSDGQGEPADERDDPERDAPPSET